MTIYYAPTTYNLFLGAYMHTNQSPAGIGNNGYSVSGNQVQAVTLFSGVQPSASSFQTNWASSYFPNYLIHWTNPQWDAVGVGTTVGINIYSLTVPPSSTTANASGTATWGVLWTRSIGSLSSTLPTTYFILGPVSVIGGNGLFRLSSTSITSGNSYVLNDGGFTMNLPSLP